MISNPMNDHGPSASELQDAYRTMIGSPADSDDLTIRLEKIDDLMSKVGPLPPGPVIIWEEEGKPVRHASVGDELVVGRQTGEGGLTLSGDNLLGRRHFVIRNQGDNCLLEDLTSRNGTAVNETRNRVQSRLLRDGDIIFAGNHIFVFLLQHPAPK